MSHFIVIMSGPSGCGKTSVIKDYIHYDPSFALSISSTTRSKRGSEQNNVDYEFLSPAQFDQYLQENAFLEHVHNYGHSYGTRKEQLDTLLKTKHVILDITVEGARNVKNLYKNAVSVFLLPPNMQVLQERITKRSQDSLEAIEERMTAAMDEIAHWNEYDYVLVNEDFGTTMEFFKTILRAEKLKHAKETIVETRFCVPRETQ